MKNEFKDCYEVANTEQCSDIRNGRCTWLIVEGKRRANKKQMNILEENYGFNDQRKVDEVLNVYNELGLKEAFLESNQAAYGRVLAKIHQNAETISPSVFTYVLESLKLFDGREIL
ncbi:hypothetical protein ONE63_005195 [Megalurothrips usitatus]|uniref:Uncharacterized protein n=1 Tax=Megalurothrips usitatus TaxID=439358 RepID=A0AAV7XUP1_9NEOP|nr:hypothetical protein ONE63_005195 [Megalurothrips usitatus]